MHVSAHGAITPTGRVYNRPNTRCKAGLLAGCNQFLYSRGASSRVSCVVGETGGSQKRPSDRKRRRPRRKGPRSEPLPPSILTEVLARGHALWNIVRTQQEAPLATLETATLTAIREASPRLLAAVVTGSQLSLQPAAERLRWRCPACETPARVQSWRSRSVLPICGRLTVERPWCVCPACQHGFSPTDETLGLLPRARLSAGLQEWVITQGARLRFAEAADNLDLLTGLAVSPETVRQQTEARGQALRTEEAAAIATVEQPREAAEPVDAAPGEIVVETDGVLLRYRLPSRKTEGHEVKVGEVLG